jgi:hypothetical protein
MIRSADLPTPELIDTQFGFRKSGFQLFSFANLGYRWQIACRGHYINGLSARLGREDRHARLAI